MQGFDHIRRGKVMDSHLRELTSMMLEEYSDQETRNGGVYAYPEGGSYKDLVEDVVANSCTPMGPTISQLLEDTPDLDGVCAKDIVENAHELGWTRFTDTSTFNLHDLMEWAVATYLYHCLHIAFTEHDNHRRYVRNVHVRMHEALTQAHDAMTVAMDLSVPLVEASSQTQEVAATWVGNDVDRSFYSLNSAIRIMERHWHPTEE